MGTEKPSAARDDQSWRRPWNERRRDEPKSPLWVVASCVGSGARIVGVTRAISRSGLSLVMPRRPTAVYQDLTVRDNDLSVELWVRVIDCEATDHEMYVWHVHVATAEDGWSRIVDRIND